MHSLKFIQVHISFDFNYYSFFSNVSYLWNGLPSSVVVLDELAFFKDKSGLYKANKLMYYHFSAAIKL